MESIDLRENVMFSTECDSPDSGQMCIGYGEENQYHLWTLMLQNLYIRFCMSRRYLDIQPNLGVVSEKKRGPHVIGFKDNMPVRPWDDGKDEPRPKAILHWGTKWDQDSGFGSATDQAKKVTFEVTKLGSDEVHVCRLDRTLTFADIWFDFLLMIRRISGHQVVKLLEKVEGTYQRVRVTEYLPQEIGMDRSFAVHVIEESLSQGLGMNQGPSDEGPGSNQGISDQGPFDHTPDSNPGPSDQGLGSY